MCTTYVYVQVSSTQLSGLTEAEWRRWVLQMKMMLSRTDESVMTAILQWNEGVKKKYVIIRCVHHINI